MSLTPYAKHFLHCSPTATIELSKTSKALGQAGSGGYEASFQHVEEVVEDGAGPEYAGVTPQDGQWVNGQLWG